MMMSISSYPPGYTFQPADYEVIYHLENKINNGPPLIQEMNEVDLSKYDPKTLSVTYPELGKKQWYFFTSRNRKYRNGSRPDRSAGDGFWKATGADQKVKNDEGKVVGYKKTLVYYKGPHQKSVKTNWIMHEYRVNQSRHDKTDANDMKLDEWVLCRIHEKVWKSKRKNQHEDEEEEEEDETTAISMVNYESSSSSSAPPAPTPAPAPAAVNYESQQMVAFESVTAAAAEEYDELIMRLQSELGDPLPDFDEPFFHQQPAPLLNQYGGFDHHHQGVGVGGGLSNQYENPSHQGVLGVIGGVSNQYENSFQQGVGVGGGVSNQYENPSHQGVGVVGGVSNQYENSFQQGGVTNQYENSFKQEVGSGGGMSNQYENSFKQEVGSEGGLSNQYESSFQQGVGVGGGAFDNQYGNVFDQQAGGGNVYDDFSTQVFTNNHEYYNHQCIW